VIGPVLKAPQRAVAVLLLLDVRVLAAQFCNHRADRRQVRLAGTDRFRRQRSHQPGSDGLPGCCSRFTTFTWVVSSSAQSTVASTSELRGVSGAIAVTVPRANGPRLVGASGPLSMASDCRKALVKRTVSPDCKGALTLLSSGHDPS
jgi:hypothetical protein